MKLSNRLYRFHSIQIGVKHFLLILFVACMLHSGETRADALTALRTTLQGLNANTEIKGALDVQSIKVNAKANGGKHKDGKQKPPAQLQLEINAGDGLGIYLSSALLQQINDEQQAHADDSEKPTPTTDLLRNVGPMEVEHIMSTAPMLLHELNGAESPTIKPSQLDGAPAQELTVTVPLKASKKDSSNISDYQGAMTLWLNAQGMPLAYQQAFHAKFCKFFLCVTVNETRNGKLQVINGRLITLSYRDETKQSGLGQDSDTKIIYTLSLNVGPDVKDKIAK